MTGADHFNDIMQQCQSVASGFPESMQASAFLTFLNGMALGAAGRCQSEGDFASAHDIIDLAVQAQATLGAQILVSDSDAPDFLVRLAARASGQDVPLIDPPFVPATKPTDDEMGWALAAIDESEFKPAARCVMTIPLSLDTLPVCCFGGGPAACGKVLDSAVVFIAEGGYSSATYCKHHTDVTKAAIEIWRQRSGAMTQDEIDALDVAKE